ncbi:hypothetical protein KKE85_01520 [Patescibacteria group bacterium]|nr:hypothetical protein [Patescibacteria group bacterium]MBU4078279.1 hypothetical protein [Patescibacteria group bacterium]MBU4162276.1 hypothetical protein [Patescibacteria group bacterium]
MKKTTLIFPLILVILSLFIIVGQAQAQITITNPLTPGNIDFDEMLIRVLGWVFGFALVIGVLMVIIGGYMMIVSSGDPERFSTGRKTVVYALSGVAIVTVSRGIIALVGQILPQGVDAGTALYNIIVYAFGFLIVISVLMLIIAAFLFITGGGNPEQTTKAKRWLIYALIGLTVAVISRGLVALVLLIVTP